MLLNLKQSLPQNYRIETCFFCRFSSYSVYGNDNFGQLICFKNCKETFLNIKDKDDYIDVLNELEVVNKVEETHYCDEFQLIKASDWIYKNQIK